MDSGLILLVGTISFVLAGAIKGISGIGLPTAAIAGMTLLIEPRVAISLILFPMVGLNFWQWLKSGEIIRTVKRYRYFAIVLIAGVAVTTVLSKDVGNRGLFAALGFVMVIFVIVSWGRWLPKLNPRYDIPAQIGFASFAGVIGGLTAAWAAPIGMYLSMREASKDEFIRVSGYLITVGSIPLCVLYAQLGFLTGPLALTSLAMLVPALIGYSLGEWFRNRLSADHFRHAILLVFLLLAVNLFRRAIWYS